MASEILANIGSGSGLKTDSTKPLPKPKLTYHHLSLWLSPGIKFNSLWPSDAIWWQRSGSILVQVMACCLTAPNHYQNQCWLIISKVQWHSSEDNFTWDTLAINHTKIILKKISFKSPRGQGVKGSALEFENYSLKITSISPRGQWVNKPMSWTTLCYNEWVGVLQTQQFNSLRPSDAYMLR